MSTKTSKDKTAYFDEFNDPSEADTETATASPKEDFAAMLGESLKKPKRKLSVGDKIKGEILVLGNEDVFVATGGQNDGVISKRDICEPDGTCKYKRGDLIELYVTQVRGTEVRLSKNPTDKNLAEDIEDAFDMMIPIEGKIVEVCKGGVRVSIKGKTAFCPISQIDIKHVETPEEYIGRNYEFRITEFKEGGRNIVVSRRKILEEERELNSASFLEEHKDGEIVPGKVARLEKFGAFVELAPGVDGLVHISEIAWSRINDPSEVVLVGQPVMVKILKRETVNGRMKLSLSIKQAMDRPEKSAEQAVSKDDPWSKYSIGQVVSGTVNRKELYGLFIQLEPGITGLLHKSKGNDRPEFQIEKLKLGDTVSVQIGEINRSDRRISLDVPRDPNENDWKEHMKTQSTASLGSLGGAFGAKLQAAIVPKDKKAK